MFRTTVILGTQQKITAPFHLIGGRNAQFLFIRRIFPEDLFLTGFLNPDKILFILQNL